MKILLLGASGMLARELARQCPSSVALTGLSRLELDVQNAQALERVLDRTKPACTINCAAYSKVDAAEGDWQRAFSVNAKAVETLGRLCAVRSIRVVHFSTDYVFDGALEEGQFYDENDRPRPLNAYGSSKLAGERALMVSGAQFLLIRTQWLFGLGGMSFVELMCRRALAGEPTRVVADEFGCCTYTVDLARASWSLIEALRTGVFHIANRGRVSRHDLARRVFEHFGVPSRLAPCSTSEFGSSTARPPNSPLSVSKTERAIGWKMPQWQDALDRFLEARKRQKSDADHS